MQVRKIRVATILFVFWSVAATCVADSWSLPETQTVYSRNRQFAVTIIPRQLAGQLEYFQDKVEGRADAGAAEGVANNWPRALFYSVDPNQQLHLVAEFRLVNEVAPVTALVSNDGQHLATFDNWHSRGHGSDAIVIYRTDGSLVRSLSLEDVLTPKDFAVLPRSVSSIQWGAQHSIDEDRHLLVLRIARCTGQDLCLEMPPEVAIHLADGTLVRPARDLLPQLEPTVRVRPGTTPSGHDGQVEPDDPICASQASFSRAPEVPFDRLQLATADLALPDFPELARKARVRGSVLLELLVDDGVVACVRTIMGLPLGLTGSARDAALQWRFLPSPDRIGPVRSVVAFDFNLVGVKPKPEM